MSQACRRRNILQEKLQNLFLHTLKIPQPLTIILARRLKPLLQPLLKKRDTLPLGLIRFLQFINEMQQTR
jgi:hypothetical protein